MTVTTPDTITPGGTFPVALSGDVARPNGTRVEMGLAAAEGTAQRVRDASERGDGLRAYVGGGTVVPILTDSNGKILIGVDVATGEIVGDFDVLGALDAYYKQNVTLRSGGVGVYTGSGTDIPIVTDVTGKVLLSINNATGMVGGVFDVARNIANYLLANISPPANGLNGYSGAATIVPVLTDATGKTLIGVNRNTGDVVLAGQQTASATAAKVRTALPAANKFALSDATVYGVVAYGQSLSLGAQGKPAISTVAPPYANYTFAAGPKTTLTGNGFGGTNQSDMSSWKALVEDNLNPDNNDSRGETILSGMLNGAVELAALENGMAPASLSFFGSTAGHGGWSIDKLKPGYIDPDTAGATVNWYQNFLDHVTKQRAISIAAGKAYVCAAIPWMQLEADAGQTKAWYKTRATTLFARLQADVIAITGQTVKPHIICYQPPYGVTSGAGPHLALLELAQENVDIHICPMDGLPYAGDGTHITNIGYLRFGHRLARLLKDLVVDGVRPVWISPKSAVVQGNYVRVKFSVPVPPLVIDVSSLASTTGMGFKVTSATVSPNVIDVTVENGDTIVLQLDAAPGANPVVRCGMDYLGAGLLINQGATHNIRDSEPLTFRKSGATYPTWNVAPHFTIPAFTLDAGA